MLNKVINIVKETGINWVAEKEVITVFVGTLNLYIQVEESDTRTDTSAIQVWVSDEDNRLSNAYHEHEFDPTDDQIKELVLEGIEACRKLNRNIGRLSVLFTSIQEYVIENEVPLEIVDRLWEQIDFE